MASEETHLRYSTVAMTLERYTKVIDTPGPDRVLVCMAPPAVSGCTEVPIRKRR